MPLGGQPSGQGGALKLPAPSGCSKADEAMAWAGSERSAAEQLVIAAAASANPFQHNPSQGQGCMCRLQRLLCCRDGASMNGEPQPDAPAKPPLDQPIPQNATSCCGRRWMAAWSGRIACQLLSAGPCRSGGYNPVFQGDVWHRGACTEVGGNPRALLAEVPKRRSMKRKNLRRGRHHDQGLTVVGGSALGRAVGQFAATTLQSHALPWRRQARRGDTSPLATAHQVDGMAPAGHALG